MSPPLRSDPLGLVVTIRPEHRLNEHELLQALAVARDGCIIGTMMTANASRTECEDAIRHVLWELGNSFTDQLAQLDDAEERMSWAREMYARHFTTLYAPKDQR